jgi:hypothetical protein
MKSGVEVARFEEADAAALARDRGELFPGFLPDRRLLAAGEQALVVKHRDLPLELTGGPVLVCGFVHVPFARFGVLHAQQKTVMGPGQLLAKV